MKYYPKTFMKYEFKAKLGDSCGNTLAAPPVPGQVRRIALGPWVRHVTLMREESFGCEKHWAVRWVGFDGLYHCGWLPSEIIRDCAVDNGGN